MDCLLLVLQLCLFDPTNLYLTAGVESTFSTDWTYRIQTGELNGGVLTREIDQDFGVVDVGLIIPSRDGRWVGDIGVRHRSFLSTGSDDANYSWYAEVTWRPFKH